MKPSEANLIKFFQARVAEGAIGPSSLRNQGNSGVLRRARQYLAGIKLYEFSSGTEASFRFALEKHTEKLRRYLPARARHWGTARKALNLFLRDVLYHRYLSKHFRFQRVEKWLELPLDRYVAEGIMSSTIDVLPRWRGIVHVAPEESALYQRAARRFAQASGIAPIHLDIYWWRDVGRRNG